ncbi:MAG: NAD(P)H-binding protein [Halioglobus sp.]
MQRRLSILHYLNIAACISLLIACTAQPPQQPDQHPARPTPATEQKSIALLGATGMVGDFLLREALSRGHKVTALARSPVKLQIFEDQITIIQGDARDPIVIAALLDGADAVISALGPVKADGDAARFISTTVTRNIVQEMERTGISDYLLVSGAGVVLPDDKRNLLGWWIRKLAQIGLRDTLEDKQAEYDVLAASSVDWVLVRCPLIDPDPVQGAPMTSLLTPPAFRLRAGELARFILDQIETGDYHHQGPFLGSQSH